MKAKILASYLLEHPELEVLGPERGGELMDIKPTVSTALYSPITDSTGEKIIVKEDEDFILIERGEL